MLGHVSDAMLRRIQMLWVVCLAMRSEVRCSTLTVLYRRSRVVARHVRTWRRVSQGRSITGPPLDCLRTPPPANSGQSKAARVVSLARYRWQFHQCNACVPVRRTCRATTTLGGVGMLLPCATRSVTREEYSSKAQCPLHTPRMRHLPLGVPRCSCVELML